ncbi:hypothetical protein LINPERPRIM_LOCUS9677 [Linum perenne]
MLDQHNALAQSFRRVRDELQKPNSESLRLRISGARVANDRRYELPSGTDLAGLIPGDFEPDHEERDIIVNNRSTGLTRITSLNPLFDSLHFPLLFPHGNDGFHELILYNPLYATPTKKGNQAHMNVEICHKGQLIKYLFKYILKEEPRDEIANYLDCRSISSYEAVWRLFQYKIHERTPFVFRLSVHLPGQHTVTWREGQTVNGILNRPNVGKTMLTKWFTLNRTCRSTHKYTYSEVTHAFTWDTQALQWIPRNKGFAIGRCLLPTHVAH